MATRTELPWPPKLTPVLVCDLGQGTSPVEPDEITTSLLQACQVRGNAGRELAVSVTQGLRVSCLRPDEEPGKVIHLPAPPLKASGQE